MPLMTAARQSTKSLGDSGRLACVRINKVLSPQSKRGVAHEYGFDQPVASAHDRGHERALALCGHAEATCGAASGWRRFSSDPLRRLRRRIPPVPIAPCRSMVEHLYPQSDHERGAAAVARNVARLDL